MTNLRYAGAHEYESVSVEENDSKNKPLDSLYWPSLKIQKANLNSSKNLTFVCKNSTVEMKRGMK